MSSSDNLIQVNGFWVDLATVESTLITALSAYSLISIKLVTSATGPRLALFYTSLCKTDDLAFLKAVRDLLLTCHSFPETLASLISFTQQLPEMPTTEDGEIDVFALRLISEERREQRKSSRKSRGPQLDSTNSQMSQVRAGMLSPSITEQYLSASRAVSMPPMVPSAFSSTNSTSSAALPTIVIHSPKDPLTSSVPDQNSLSPPDALPPKYRPNIAYPPPVRPSSIMDVSIRSKVALEIASHVTTLLALPASSSIPTYFPLNLAGLNSITTAQLYFWLQERYEYDQDISRLFEDGVSSESLANHIAGLQPDNDVSGARMSTSSVQSNATFLSQYSQDSKQPLAPSFDDIDLETGVTKGQIDEKPQVYTIKPNPLSYVFVSWLTNLLFLGNRKPLTADDLHNLNPKDESRAIDEWTDDFWKEYDTWSQNPTKKTPRLWGSMMKASRRYIYPSALLWFMSISFALFGPILIQQLIICVSAPPKPSTPEGAEKWKQAIEAITGGIPLFTSHLYILALSFFSAKVLQTICGRTSDQLIRGTALNIKTALVGAVYHKSLRLGVQGVGKFEKGYILNLINVDVEAISRAVEFGNLVWAVPLQLGAIVYLLSRVLGVSVWAGVGVLFLALLALILVVPLFFRTSAPMFMRYGDKRIKLIKEVMEGITLIKVRGWEAIFLQKLESIRQTQLGYLRTFNIGIAAFVVIGQLANTLIPLAALSLFGKEMGTITAARVFPAISFFTMLVEPLIALPQIMSSVAVAMTSWGRIYKFLLAAEVTPDVNHSISDDPIRIVNGTFQWVRKDDEADSEKSKPFMHDINVSIKQGSLTAIVGNVGSGKSSLLSAVLGEMECISGKVSVNGTFAYCPQQAWIQSSTVQENIVFGKPMDTRRLKRAVGAASFAADLERLPNGIASEIAERGANLSGGQKARLSLARAVYADADIVILDDPLAALDPRVGRTVFQECILEALHGKTRLLVTQALQFLPQVDHILVVNDGTIIEQGSYAQLHRAKGHLRNMIDAMETRSDGPSKKAAPRQDAKVAKKQVKREEDASSGSITSEEDVVTGAISGATWWGYMKAAGGWVTITALICSLLLQQVGAVMMNQWLVWWTGNEFHEKVQFWFGIYDGIGFGVAGLMILVNTIILLGVLKASRKFHNKAFSGVLSAPMSWYHANPGGRVINRFSKDVDSVDQRLMPQIFQVVTSTGSMITAISVISRSAPVLLAILGPFGVIIYFLLRFYRRSLRELKRLESKSISPLQSKVNETLDGIPTIAAFKREKDFAGSAHHLIDNSNKALYIRTSAEIWVTLRVELMTSLIVLTVAMLGNATKVMSVSGYGIALSYASIMTYILNTLIKSSATLESEMSSVERLQEYAESLPKDAEAHLLTDPVEGSWPSRGEIVFNGVTAAYPSRPEKPVLRDVNIRIEPGTTVFIVGRTGSGKSTLLSILLRLLEIGSGSVIVDGEDISKLGVHTLRRGMELIPQDPFIFSGTIRTALDFESRYDDTSLWQALELVGLKDFVTSQEQKLDTTVSDNGSNYSVGQRQLICLAGAILRNPRILLLDEATASVDAGSDAFLQKTMRSSCPGATILSVMHRLSEQVLQECDKVLVMDDGVPAEFDTPKALKSNPDSLFSRIMEATNH